MTKRSAKALLDEILSVSVSDNEGLSKAATLLVEIKAQQKTAKELKDKALAPVKEAVRYISSLFAEPESILASGEGHLKDQIKTYREEAERKHTAMLEAAQSPQEVADAVAVIPDKPAGISERVVWRWEVEDESRIPDDYWILDEKRIGAMVRLDKEDFEVPGIKVIRDVTMVVRST